MKLSSGEQFLTEFSIPSKAALIPWDPEEFEDGAMNKFFSILMSPLYLACKLTVPIVAEDYSGVVSA